MTDLAGAAAEVAGGPYASGDALFYRSVHGPLVVWVRGDDGRWWGYPDHDTPAEDGDVTETLAGSGGSVLVRAGTADAEAAVAVIAMLGRVATDALVADFAGVIDVWRRAALRGAAHRDAKHPTTSTSTEGRTA